MALSLNPHLEIRYEDEFMGSQVERTKKILQVIKKLLALLLNVCLGGFLGSKYLLLKQ